LPLSGDPWTIGWGPIQSHGSDGMDCGPTRALVAQTPRVEAGSTRLETRDERTQHL